MTGAKVYKNLSTSPVAYVAKIYTDLVKDCNGKSTIDDYLTSIKTGKTPPKSNPLYFSFDDGMSWVKPSDIGLGKYVVTTKEKVTQLAIDNKVATTYEPNSLLLVSIGDVGRISIAQNEVSSNQQISGLLFNDDVIPEYAYYYFLCRGGLFKEAASQTTLPIINQKKIKEISFKCPSIANQNEFLRYISYCEECFENSTTPNAKNYELPETIFKVTERIFNTYYCQLNISSEIDSQLNYIQLLRQTILQEAVQGKLVPQDPNDEPATELLKKIQAEKEQLIKDKKIKKPKPLPPITNDEIPYELPQGWVWCRLGDISFSSYAGKSHKCSDRDVQNEEWGIIKMSAISSGIFLENENKFFSTDAPKNLDAHINPNDLLFARASGSRHLTGVCTVIKSISKNLLLNDKTIRYIIQDLTTSIYIWHYNNSYYGRAYYEEIMGNKTTTMNNITRDQFNSLPIPLPPLTEQKRIVAKVEHLMQICDELEAQVQQSKTDAEQLLQALLREAFEGDKIEESITIASEPEEKAFLKRKILGSYIINQSLNDDQFGDVKFEKLLHLADYHALKRNLNQKYFQQAAGPYDNAFTIPFFKQLDRDKWFTRIKEGKRFHFSEGINHNKSLNTYGYFSDEELNEINTLVGYFNKSNYEQPEIVSTLYAVWNNRIIQKQPITDEILIKDFYNWDKEKKKYKWERLVKALTWMRDVELVPDGWGKIITKKIKKQ